MVRTLKKNYRLPVDLVLWMEEYAKARNITITALIIECLADFRRRKRL